MAGSHAWVVYYRLVAVQGGTAISPEDDYSMRMRRSGIFALPRDREMSDRNARILKINNRVIEISRRISDEASRHVPILLLHRTDYDGGLRMSTLAGYTEELYSESLELGALPTPPTPVDPQASSLPTYAGVKLKRPTAATQTWESHVERPTRLDGTLGPRTMVIRPSGARGLTSNTTVRLSVDGPDIDRTRMAVWRGVIPDVGAVTQPMSINEAQDRLEHLRKLARAAILRVIKSNPGANDADVAALARTEFSVGPDVTEAVAQEFVSTSHVMSMRAVWHKKPASAALRRARVMAQQLRQEHPGWSAMLVRWVATGRLNRQLAAEGKELLPGLLSKSIFSTPAAGDGSLPSHRVNVRRNVVRELPTNGPVSVASRAGASVTDGFELSFGFLATVAVALRVGGWVLGMGMWVGLIGRRWSWWGCMWRRRAGSGGRGWCGWWWG